MSDNQTATTSKSNGSEADAKKNERLKRLHQLRMKQVLHFLSNKLIYAITD